MTIKEITLKVENKPGALAQVIARLHENDIKVCALGVEPQNKSAAVRLIVSDPDGAVSVLAGLGVKAATGEVVAVEIPNHPGGLNSILKVLAAGDINIRGIYPTFDTSKPIMILDVDKTKDAVNLLKSQWIKVLDERVYRL